MPIALYYKGIVTEYSPDTNLLGQKEVLHFYSDYPHERARKIWWTLYRDFPGSPESIEARWRSAWHQAGRGAFEQAEELLDEAQTMLVDERNRLLEAEQESSEKVFGLFSPPADSVMTPAKLDDLQRRLDQLRILINPRNRTNEPGYTERLARFVMLNPHASGYAQQLDGLLEQTEEGDKLRDDILLAQAKLVADEQLRAEKLAELHNQYKQTDAGMLALYELGLLKIGMWRQYNDSNAELKKKYLEETRATLMSFVSLYPESRYAEQVKKNLDGLPAK
jgi:hypothetical protein